MNDVPDRRGFLKLALAAIAGVAGGHSILTSNAFAQKKKAAEGYIQAKVRPLTIRLPETLEYTVKGPGQRVLSPASEKQLAESIAPMLDHLVASAGIKLSPDEAKELRNAFVDRGVVDVRSRVRGGRGINLSITSSLSWES